MAKRILIAMPSYFRDPDTPNPNIPPRIGVCALIERDGHILVERRSDDGGWWAFIGGSLHENETLLETLHREVLEETGFTIAGATLFGLFSDPTRVVAYPDGNICVIISVAFRVTPAELTEPILSSESLEMQFVRHAALCDLAFWPVHRPIRDALLAEPTEVVIE